VAHILLGIESNTRVPVKWASWRIEGVALDGKVAEEVWTGNEVDYSSLRVFGCPAYVQIPSEERLNLDPKFRQCAFLGYRRRVKGYKLWDLKANKAVINRNVIFSENFMLKSTQGEE
jgi:hypothetical protein